MEKKLNDANINALVSVLRCLGGGSGPLWTPSDK